MDDGINRALARLRQQDLIREAQRWQRVREARPGRGAWATLVAAARCVRGLRQWL